MINIAEIRNAFRTRIAQSGIIPVANIAWENLAFIPANKSVWAQENYLPAVEEADTSYKDMLSGIIQITVSTPVDTSDVVAVETGVAIGNLWETQEEVDTDNYRITIDRTKCSFLGKLDDIWYSYILDIEFRAFEK
jgi:hypothetical protein